MECGGSALLRAACLRLLCRLLLVVSLVSIDVFVAEPAMASSQEEWLLREQREALERQRREARPDIRLELPEAETEPFGPPPEEALCFVIDDVQLEPSK